MGLEPVPASPADQANQQMVDRLIVDGCLWSAPLIAAFRATPRHQFLDRVFQYQRKHNRWRELITRDPSPEELRLIYSDRALITRLSPASHREPAVPISSSSQPSLMAQMLEDLAPAAGQRVLEVGAGTGYNAALLAHAVRPGVVVSVDVDREVLAEAWDHLREFPDRRVELKHADGRSGYAEGAPYDRIMVTAATPEIEAEWVEQLAEGGLLLAPLALAPGISYVVQGRVVGGTFQGRLTRAAYFMPLRAEGETGAAEGGPLPPAGVVRTLPAPWAGWFDSKRTRGTWLIFSQSLAFYALLRGLTVHYRVLENGPPVFGVSDKDTLCWLGVQDWHGTGAEGRDLAWVLWRGFLNAGAPRPTEYRLTVGFTGSLSADRPKAFLRHRPNSEQLWVLPESRERPAWLIGVSAW